MRHLRPFPALIAIAVIGAACSGPGASSGGDRSQAAQQSQGGGASQPAASTGGGGGGGGGANGSITYEISGDYTASGELPFVATGGSAFAGTGWAAFFYANGAADVVIDLTTLDNAHAISFGDTHAVVTGLEASGCTFNLTKNDASGLKGSVECHGAQVVLSEAGSLGTADISAQWDAHP